MVYILDQASGLALSQQHQRIAELIQDYNPDLELAWIPPADRTVFDKEPFAIFHNGPKGRYLVGTFREDQMDHRIIAHLFKIDNHQTNVLDDLEMEERAREALRLKTLMDEHEEKKDFANHLLKSRKHYYRHNGKVYS